MLGDPSTAALAVVAGMAVVTYLTKVAGFWTLARIDPPEWVQSGLDALPGGIIVAILTVRILEGGPPEWLAGVAVLIVARQTDNVLLAMAAGVGTLLLLRHPATPLG
jgi:uncharacterized membrane protein